MAMLKQVFGEIQDLAVQARAEGWGEPEIREVWAARFGWIEYRTFVEVMADTQEGQQKMTNYAIFRRGSTNTCNAVDDCVWVCDAVDTRAAKRDALDHGVTVYQGQYLEALEPWEFSAEDQDLIAEWQPTDNPW